MKLAALCGLLVLLVLPAAAQTTPLVCSASTLSGPRSLVLTGRNVSTSVALVGDTLSVGTASFDGVSAVTFSLMTNTSQTQGMTQTLSGTYTLASNCVGAISIATGDTASYTLIVYNQGKNFTLTGEDGVYVLAGSGSTPPAACVTSTLSGGYAMNGNGIALVAGLLSGVNSISGDFQFDGKGGITGNWSVAGATNTASVSVSGQYSVSTGCQAVATVKDNGGIAYTLNFTMTAADGSDFSADIASLTGLFSITGHSSFTNPGNAVVNAASGASGGTPPGSIFSVYGSGLATGAAQPNSVPLLTTELSTTVTVNGEAVPFFYVSPTQINAQMPLDVQSGVATVVVTNGSSTSNAAAITVPGTGTPGIFVYDINRAVVQNPDFSVNSPTSPAHVGDTLVGYLTGGGPVQASGVLMTGHPSPEGLSQVTENYSLTVGGQTAVVNYLGLTPTLIGVYQVNFVVPQVSAGDQHVVVTINGVASNSALINVVK